MSSGVRGGAGRFDVDGLAVLDEVVPAFCCCCVCWYSIRSNCSVLADEEVAN